MLAITTRWHKVKELKSKFKIGDIKKTAYRGTHTIRFAMLTTYVAVTLVALGIMYAYNIGILSENLYSENTVKLYAKANIISQSASEMWESEDENVMYMRAEAIFDRLLAGTNIRGVLTDSSYNVRYDTNIAADMVGKVFMRDVLKRAIDGEQCDSVIEADSGNTLTVAVPIERDGEIVGGELAELLAA